MHASNLWDEVEVIIREAEASGGSVGVAIECSDGSGFTHNGDRKFRAASTIKIPVMIEVYRQVDRGERKLTDPYILRHEDKTFAGAGVMLHLQDGAQLVLNDLIYLMISLSDNTASNLLIDMAGLENTTKTMRSLGMSNSNVSRRMQGRAANSDESENWATPNDYNVAIKAILEGRAATKESCSRMLDMLSKHQNTRRIARYLPKVAKYLPEGGGAPKDYEVRWGSKAGSLGGVVNDSGYISTPHGSMIISVFTEDLADQYIGEKVIGDISRAAMKATGIVEPIYTS